MGVISAAKVLGASQGDFPCVEFLWVLAANYSPGGSGGAEPPRGKREAAMRGAAAPGESAQAAP